MKISLTLRAWARTFMAKGTVPTADRFYQPALPPGVAPAVVVAKMAQDNAGAYGYLNQSTCGTGFMGYPALAELTQQPEYRMLSEKTAQAMVRKWIKITTKGDGDKTDVIAAIESDLLKYKVRELFAEAAKFDGFFGRCQIFIDLGLQEGDELQTPMIMASAKIGVGKLRKFKLVEPVYTFPYRYSASNPLADDYYNPQAWYVMGQLVHSSRLLLFVSRPVPDMLKPSYNFGGLALSQLSKPYVDNWLKTRTSVARLISNFSTSGIKTNLSTVLQGDSGDDLIARAELYTSIRDNQGLMLLDNESEEFFQVNTPLTTLDKLQAQAQEQMASVSNTPTSILLGLTPTGLNASTDGEVRTYYDHVHDMQRVLFGDNLTKVLNIIQLNRFGAVDPDIVFEFVPLWQMDSKESSDQRKSDAEAAQLYFEMGAVSAEEVRGKLAADPESGFTGLPEVAVGLTPPEDDEPSDDTGAEE